MSFAKTPVLTKEDFEEMDRLEKFIPLHLLDQKAGRVLSYLRRRSKDSNDAAAHDIKRTLRLINTYLPFRIRNPDEDITIGEIKELLEKRVMANLEWASADKMLSGASFVVMLLGNGATEANYGTPAPLAGTLTFTALGLTLYGVSQIQSYFAKRNQDSLDIFLESVRDVFSGRRREDAMLSAMNDIQKIGSGERP
jgi:hypothetical protein